MAPLAAISARPIRTLHFKFQPIRMSSKSAHFWGCQMPPHTTDGCGNCRSNSAVRSFNFKLSTLTYRALFTQQPPYLASLLHLLNIPRTLRSSISQQLIVPKTKLNLGKRAFSVAAPRVWNELPITLKTSETIAIFRKKLTTYLFQIAFPP